MARVVLTRLLFLPVVLLGVTLVLFVIGQIMPADPAAMLISDRITPEVRAAIEAKYGFDQPAHVQYWRYLVRLVHGDLGESTRYQLPIARLLADAFPATMVLILTGAVMTMFMVFPLGFAAARFRGTWIDGFVRSFAMVGLSTPAFYLGIVLILVAGFHLGMFPISGRGAPPDLHHLILPAFVLGFHDAGSSVRVLRANLLDALSDDYIRAARARGLGERRVLYKLAGCNALIPTITDLGVNFAGMGGTVILVETVFAWPGIGRLLFEGIRFNDFPLISGSIILLLSWVVVVNLAVDVLYRAIDPRVRTAENAGSKD